MDIVKPDFAALNGQALVDTYNQYVSNWRKAKFSSKEQGVKACEKAFSDFVKKNGYTVFEEDQVPVYIAAKEKEAAEVAKLEKKVVIEEKIDAPPPSNAPKRIAGRIKHHWVIKIIAPTNPRREKSKGWHHFETMRSVHTVGEYLAQYETIEARKTAAQWLGNTVRDGFIQLVEP